MQFFNFIRIILLPANAGIATTCMAQLLLLLVDCSVFRVIKIILLPATAGIAVTCTASVLHQPCITSHTIVLLLLLSLLVDCYFSKKRDYPTAAVFKAS